MASQSMEIIGYMDGHVHYIISLDPETGEVSVLDAAPASAFAMEGLRPRVDYDNAGNLTRPYTPAERAFGGLVSWTAMSARDRDEGPWGGAVVWDFQPWLEILLRQAVRLIQLHGMQLLQDVADYIASNGPGWVGGAITGIVLQRFADLFRRSKETRSHLADQGLAPSWPEDPRFDYARLADDEVLAELLARIAYLMAQQPDQSVWDAVVRGEDIGLKTVAEDLQANANVVLGPEEAEDEGPDAELLAEVERRRQEAEAEVAGAPHFITLDLATGEIAVKDERPSSGSYIQAPRMRVVPDSEGEPSRPPTPTEAVFDGLVDWLLLDTPENRGLGQYGGGFAPNFQPWTEILIRQTIRLIQLHGHDLVSYLSQHAPDWAGGAVFAAVLDRAPTLWGRLKLGLSRMAASAPHPHRIRPA
jgi:hypothetical protein